MSLREWRKSGAYLPPSIRDFHDQKDLFKAIHELYDLDTPKDHRGTISWTDAHIYTIDSFLWFMAGHGFTLQRCRAKQPFLELDQTVAAARKKRDDAFAAMLNEAMTKGSSNTSTAEPT